MDLEDYVELYIDARKLHRDSGLTTPYVTWIGRLIEKLYLVEGIDYVEAASLRKNAVSKKRGHNITHLLTLQSAKRILEAQTVFKAPELIEQLREFIYRE